MAELEHEIGWDDAIENDSSYELLPECECDFQVMTLDRKRYNGGAKLPACNMAELSIKVTAADGKCALVTHRLYLHTSTEGLLCAFFTAIGQRKHGEKLKPNWNAVPGSIGRCKLGIHKYVNKDGEEREANQIAKFLGPKTTAATPASGWKPGAF